MLENFIGGKFVACKSHIDSYDPSTGEVYCSVPDSGPEEVGHECSHECLQCLARVGNFFLKKFRKLFRNSLFVHNLTVFCFAALNSSNQFFLLHSQTQWLQAAGRNPSDLTGHRTRLQDALRITAIDARHRSRLQTIQSSQLAQRQLWEETSSRRLTGRPLEANQQPSCCQATALSLTMLGHSFVISQEFQRVHKC